MEEEGGAGMMKQINLSVEETQNATRPLPLRTYIYIYIYMSKIAARLARLLERALHTERGRGLSGLSTRLGTQGFNLCLNFLKFEFEPLQRKSKRFLKISKC